MQKLGLAPNLCQKKYNMTNAEVGPHPQFVSKEYNMNDAKVGACL